MTSKKVRKPKLTQANLLDHGISYNVNLDGRTQLPPHVEDLRHVLLSFHNILPNGEEAMFEGEKEALEEMIENAAVTGKGMLPLVAVSALQAASMDSLPNQEAYESKTRRHKEGPASSNCITAEEIASAQLAARQARWHLQQNVMENVWVSLLSLKIFRPYYEAKGFDPSSHDSLFHGYAVHENELWTSATKLPPWRKGSNLTKPKPDFSYKFMINHSSRSHHKGWKSDIARSFSLEVLGRLSLLRPNGVLCSPGAGLKNLLKTAEENSCALTCFPWAVVECKRENKDEEMCCCQAANASAFALKMFESLMLDEYLVGDDQIPPVIAFTTSGQMVKLWLTYCSKAPDKSSRYTMVRIWETSIMTTWGVIKLREVVKNMQKWAAGDLRPMLWVFIRRWRADHEKNTLPQSPPSAQPKDLRGPGTTEPLDSSLHVPTNSCHAGSLLAYSGSSCGSKAAQYFTEHEQRAMEQLNGTEFWQLDAVKSKLLRLDDTVVLEALWTAFERCKDDESYNPWLAGSFFSELNKISNSTAEWLDNPSLCIPSWEVLMREENGWKDVDQIFEAISKENPADLFSLLTKALEMWTGKECCQILGPILEDLPKSDWDTIRCQVLEKSTTSTNLRDIEINDNREHGAEVDQEHEGGSDFSSKRIKPEIGDHDPNDKTYLCERTLSDLDDGNDTDIDADADADTDGETDASDFNGREPGDEEDQEYKKGGDVSFDQIELEIDDDDPNDKSCVCERTLSDLDDGNNTDTHTDASDLHDREHGAEEDEEYKKGGDFSFDQIEPEIDDDDPNDNSYLSERTLSDLDDGNDTDTDTDASDFDGLRVIKPLSDEDVENMQRQAMNALTGTEFIEIDQVRDCIEDLHGRALVDAVCRSMDLCTICGCSPGVYHCCERLEKERILGELVATLSGPSLDWKDFYHVDGTWLSGAVTQAIRDAFGRNETRVKDFFRSHLRSLRGDQCLDILAPELGALSPGDWRQMECDGFEAFLQVN